MEKHILRVSTASYCATEKEVDFDETAPSIKYIRLPDSFYEGIDESKSKDLEIEEFISVAELHEDEIDIDELVSSLKSSGVYYPDVEPPDCCDSYVHRDCSSDYTLIPENQLDKTKQEDIEILKKVIEPIEQNITTLEQF